MATFRNNESHKIQIDSEYEDHSKMKIDEVYPSDTDSGESDDELALENCFGTEKNPASEKL